VYLLTKPVARWPVLFRAVDASLPPTVIHYLLCSPPSGKQVLSPELALFNSHRAHKLSADPPLSQAVSAGQRRFLSIHEYQSVNLLNSVCGPLLPIVLLLSARFSTGFQLRKVLPRNRPRRPLKLSTRFLVRRYFCTRRPATQLTYTAGEKGAVIKAQVLAGGRGKGKFSNGFQGGVHVVKT
jgi:hypothetical protein